MSKQHSSVRAYGILVHEDAVALVRSSNPHHVPPLWWLPGGGIDFGETPEGALIREFKEETGLSVAGPELFSVTSDVRKRDNGDRIHTVRIIYTVTLAGGDLTHEVHGTTDHAGWYPIEKLESLNLADYARVAIQAVVGK
jgi:ADP-ribose pyrophosphatase YjhB (NUDIX family)